ncbi:MAG: peroxidase, partial [Anaerolineae bacterium]|nr:peroxidase [Anaerolineae bacterium]
NIQRQFEFIQHTWCNNTKFETLYDEVDAISGAGQTMRATISPYPAHLCASG